MAYSIQAGRLAACHPAVDGLDLDDYASVEVAILHTERHRWLRPSEVGADPAYDTYWDQPAVGVWVGKYVPWDVVDDIQRVLLYTEPDVYESME